MQRVSRWLVLWALCCTARAVAGDVPPGDARLREAREAYAQAVTLHQARQYAQAVGRAEHALALREATLGGSHPTVAQSLHHLARLHQDQGRYDQAEPLYIRALAIREAVLGGDPLSVARSLTSLAGLYKAQGLYVRAEPLYARALALREAALGGHHPSVAQALSHLASLFKAAGRHVEAEPLYVRALAIREAALGGNHPDVAISLNNLAVFYVEQELYDQAEPLYVRALAIREAALGRNHPTVAESLNSLASLYLAWGHYSEAEPLYARALAIREVALGRRHPTVAASLNSLAVLYQAQGRYSEAEPLHVRALAIREAALGGKHPAVAQSLNNLASLRLAQHRLGAAVPLLARAFAVSEQRLRQEALGFSEARLDGFLRLLRIDEERIYALLHAHPDNTSVRRLALSTALLLKGRSVEEMAGVSRAVYRSLGAKERETFLRLRGLRTQLASLSLQGPGPLPLTAYQQQLKALTQEADALEASLSSRSAPLRALAALPSPAGIVDRVAAALPRDGALVELITYVDSISYELTALDSLAPGKARRHHRYLALVLLPDASIRTVDLGPAVTIDSAASRLRASLANRDAAFLADAQNLHQLAFQPLLPLLGKARQIFFSPEGQLALVPFAALHDGQRFLVEAFDFTYLTSGKELLPRSQPVLPAASVVVMADPDFSGPLPVPLSSPGEADARLHGSLGLRDWNLVPLPGTRQEAEAIQRLLPQARLFLGQEATRHRLLRLPSPGILHLATHGFFLEDTPAPSGSRAAGSFSTLGEEPLAPRPLAPLLRSGLLFAGANAPASISFRAPLSPADGAVATALELAGLDLWGTQLVVLSACDTGRGHIQPGQGVYGLRRALVMAGAETVVMSLWKVDDDSTRHLMEAYYRGLLAGQGRSTALREAMLWLRALRPHPYDWAPFVALGRNAPLRGLGRPRT
jgi:CHAT domain-containing protein